MFDGLEGSRILAVLNRLLVPFDEDPNLGLLILIPKQPSFNMGDLLQAHGSRCTSRLERLLIGALAHVRIVVVSV